jgi:hypothetical protein
MSESRGTVERSEAQTISLRDQELLWGSACQHTLLDEEARARYLEGGAPVPLPPTPPADESAWRRPLCA